MTPVILRMALVAALLGATFFVVSVQPGSAKGQPVCISHCKTVAQDGYNLCMGSGVFSNSACRQMKVQGFKVCKAAAAECAK